MRLRPRPSPRTRSRPTGNAIAPTADAPMASSGWWRPSARTRGATGPRAPTAAVGAAFCASPSTDSSEEAAPM